MNRLTTNILIVGGGYAAVHTYPMPPEPGVSRLRPGLVASSLKALPAEGGTTLDVTCLPLPFKSEELLQVAECKPPFVLRYAEQHAEVLLDWGTAHLPDALLWISNGGRAHAPWAGTHYALGIEPNNSCFDLTSVATPPETERKRWVGKLKFPALSPRPPKESARVPSGCSAKIR